MAPRSGHVTGHVHRRAAQEGGSSTTACAESAAARAGSNNDRRTVKERGKHAWYPGDDVRKHRKCCRTDPSCVEARCVEQLLAGRAVLVHDLPDDGGCGKDITKLAAHLTDLQFPSSRSPRTCPVWPGHDPGPPSTAPSWRNAHRPPAPAGRRLRIDLTGAEFL